MVCIGKNIAHCLKIPQFLSVKCVLCTCCAHAVRAVRTVCANAPCHIRRGSLSGPSFVCRHTHCAHLCPLSRRHMAAVLCICALALAWLLTALARPWDRRNNPNGWWYTPRKTAYLLPLRGRASTRTWSDTDWLNRYGGIARRWQEPGMGLNRTYPLHSLAELYALPTPQLKGLSPAEKYDIYVGRLDYPTVLSEWRRTAPPAPQDSGLSSGWAAASVLYDEPGPVTLTAPSGLRIPFGSSDVKALLTYFLREVWVLCGCEPCRRHQPVPQPRSSALCLCPPALLW